MLLQMVDGGILNFKEDKNSSLGCETCDYGSSYINELEVILTKCKIKVDIDQMYEYVLSDGDIMKIILPNVDTIKLMTEAHFAIWFEKELLKIVNDSSWNSDKVRVGYEIIKL